MGKACRRHMESLMRTRSIDGRVVIVKKEESSLQGKRPYPDAEE